MLDWDSEEMTKKDNKDSERYVTVTNVNYLQDTIKKLVNKKCCYIVVNSKQKLQDFKEWKIIMQQIFNDSTYLALIKKASSFQICDVIFLG